MADPASGAGPRLRSRASAASLPAPTTVGRLALPGGPPSTLGDPSPDDRRAAGRRLGDGRAWLALDHDGRPLATGRVP